MNSNLNKHEEKEKKPITVMAGRRYDACANNGDP